MVESRFFGGLDVSETAELLEVSEATILRDWRAARAWLAAVNSGGPHRSARWGRVQELFHAAAELDATEREAFPETGVRR